MKQVILTLTLFISIFGCHNRKSELEFEKSVMLEIFPNLIDSLWVHNSSVNTLPFVKLDKRGKVIGLEEQSKSDIRKNHKNLLDEIKRKNAKLFAVVCDTIYPVDTNEINEFKKHYNDAIFPKSKEITTLKYPFDKEKFNAFENIKIKFIAEFNMLERPWDTNDKYNFYGAVSFSRILFDTNKKYGILTSSIICGGLCGHGYQIFIKKVKNKWIIEKVEETWIS